MSIHYTIESKHRSVKKRTLLAVVLFAETLDNLSAWKVLKSGATEDLYVLVG